MDDINFEDAMTVSGLNPVFIDEDTDFNEVFKQPETNIEFVTRIMEFSPFGALSQAFVIQALSCHAELCSVERIPDAWQDCAKWIKEELEKKYGS